MPSQPARMLVTGANGHLGRLLIRRLAESRDRQGLPAMGVRALVRSERAAVSLESLDLPNPPEVVICDYTDSSALEAAIRGCRHVVHLVGIIKESRGGSYESAHELACAALVRAAEAAEVERIVYLSIFGAGPDSPNPCLASKGRAEEILLAGRATSIVLRVPMVIGPEDFASAALRGQASSRIVPLVAGGSTMQQPIDSRDVLSAILAALALPGDQPRAFDLGGPERLTHRALVARAARLYGRRPLILPIPIWLARGFVWLIERLLADPPITSSMLGVLQQDDRIDEAPTCEGLNITLTPLDDTLRSFVGPESLPE